MSLSSGVDALVETPHFLGMSTLTIELPDALALRLASASERKHLPPAQIVSEALEQTPPAANRKPELASIKALLGRVKMLDGAAYVRELRSEWASR